MPNVEYFLDGLFPSLGLGDMHQKFIDEGDVKKPSLLMKAFFSGEKL